jgi:uncharacterized damage-inducible protein DinB
MNAQRHFLLLARYNAWATARLLDAVCVLDETDYRREVGLFFRSVHGTLNHLLVGEHLLWFARFARGESPRMALDAEAERDRARLAERLLDATQAWAPVIAAWPEDRFEGTLDYSTSKGQPVSLPFTPTLTHVFNHSTHHRGQISAALTLLGQPAPGLDLVQMLMQDQQR